MKAKDAQLFGSKRVILIPGTQFCALEGSTQFKT